MSSLSSRKSRHTKYDPSLFSPTPESNGKGPGPKKKARVIDPATRKASRQQSLSVLRYRAGKWRLEKGTA